MKCYGKVIDYDGYVGTIVSDNGIKYLMFNSELVDKDINVGDIVLFDSDIYKDVEVTKYIARFIKKIGDKKI